MTAKANIFVGANAERSRSHNRQVVLDQVRAAGEIGRADIARASGLSTQAVSNIIADLLADGLIVEQGRRAVARGQPPVQYALNPKGGYAVGVEIRPDAVFAAILDLCGNSAASGRRALPAVDRDSVTRCVADLIEATREKAGTSRDKLLGAGIVMPGPFGATGIRGEGAELPIWDDTPPEIWFSEALRLPVFVENDANAAAMAETVNGVAVGLRSFAFIYFGNGIGLGTIERGRIIAGANGNAGEIGHVPVPCGGRVVPLEAAVSRLSVQDHLNRAGIRATSGAELDRLCQENDPHLVDWLDQAVEPLSAAITIVENLFDPMTVILGGAMPDSILDYFVANAQLADRSVARTAGRTIPRLQRGASGRMTATLGAAALVLDQTFTPRIAAAT